MTRVSMDDDGERLFYLCRNDAYRCTMKPGVGGMSQDWPQEIFRLAVHEGILTKEGRVVK
jgi:hypothetical protein